MLDIQKELEKFNRLLEEADDDVVGSTDDQSPVDADAGVEELPDAAPLEAAISVDDESVVVDTEALSEQPTEELATLSDSAAQVVPVSPAAFSAIHGDNGADHDPSVSYYNEGPYSSDEDDAAPEDRFDEVVTTAHVISDDEATDSEDMMSEDQLAVSHEDDDDHARNPREDVTSDEEVAAVVDKPWMVTEHVADTSDTPPEEPAFGESEVFEEEDPYPAVPDYSPVDLHVDGSYNGIEQIRFPNPGRFSFEDTVQETGSENVDSLLHGARIALTDSHHLRPSHAPAFTVTMPELQEDEEEEDIESLAARILPLLTFKAGVFEDRLGAVVGAVAGLVILVAGVLFVPRLFSEDDPEVIAEAAYASEQDHVHAAAEPLVTLGAAPLSIATFPPGARVYLNAELIGVTPFKDVAVERGDYQVSIEKNEFAAIDTFLTLDSGREFFFDLSEEKGLVTQEAAEIADHQLLQVAVDESGPPEQSEREEKTNESSSRRASASESNTRESSSKSSSRNSSRSTRRSRVEVPAVGGLVVTSEPMGASVYLGDEMVGETPATLSGVAAGSVRLMLQKEGYVAYEAEINVTQSIQTPFHAALAAVKASLFVNATPGGDLYVDGQLVSRGISPGHMELVSLGTRSIKVVHPDYGEYVQVVDVTADNKAMVVVDMVAHGYQWSIENGDRLFSESRYQEAIKNYQRAIAIRPGNGGLENKIALAAKAMAETSMPSADNRTAPIDGIYSVTDTGPQLIGGLAALHANVVYPEEAYNEGIQGRVYVQLVVDEQGKPQDITIAKGLKGGCNEAAIRAVRKSRFKPATIGGVPVKARHTLFVNFTI